MMGAVIGGTSACVLFAHAPLRKAALPQLNAFLVSMGDFVFGCGMVAADLLLSIPVVIGSFVWDTGRDLAHALPRLLQGRSRDAANDAANNSIKPMGVTAPVANGTDLGSNAAPVGKPNPSARKPAKASISDWGGLSSPSDASEGSDHTVSDPTSESDEETLGPARSRSQQEVDIFMKMGQRYSTKDEYSRCQQLLESNSRRHQKKERAAGRAPAVDSAQLVAAIRRVESLNFEGEGDDPPIRRRALHVRCSVGSRAGLWRDVFPFESSATYFRALETAEFEMDTGRRVTKYLFKHISDFVDRGEPAVDFRFEC